MGVFVKATVPAIPLPNATVMLFSSVCSVSSKFESSVTSNSFDTRYLFSLVPRTRNRLPRSPLICIHQSVHTARTYHRIRSLSDRPIIPVFRHQGSLRKSDDFTPKGGAKYKGGSDFRQICSYISETVSDRSIFTIEDEYKVVCALSNSATFDDLE